MGECGINDDVDIRPWAAGLKQMMELIAGTDRYASGVADRLDFLNTVNRSFTLSPAPCNCNMNHFDRNGTEAFPACPLSCNVIDC